MKSNNKKLIVIVGPTASGKSELAVKIASKNNGEIISADSRQVYRGLDIGTGKVPGKWTKNYGSPTSVVNSNASRVEKQFIYRKIPHHCIDFVPPKQSFGVVDFKKCAEDAIRKIAGAGKIPILVGGTGFWIDAVVHDLNYPPVLPDPKLRKKLSKKNPPELLDLLKKIDPVYAATIEQKNPRRLIRAIEIARKLGRVPKKIKKSHPYLTLWIGIATSPLVLKKKIRKRLRAHIQQGMIREATTLRKNGLAWRRFYELGLEYRHLADFLRSKIDKTELLRRLESAVIDYSRRQRVWFGRNKKIQWIEKEAETEIAVIRFLKTPAG